MTLAPHNTSALAFLSIQFIFSFHSSQIYFIGVCSCASVIHIKDHSEVYIFLSREVNLLNHESSL